ncbi:hypothetical protein Z957_11480 [Clostridium sp. K25]|uniref:PilN domain-containing protein n=1 Tax=Clostridium sp. K25 TaxID=1443109 RepID=UPI0004D484FE|nr:PilN domain-containing protein [Clostridium sp. K25]KEI06487.1 hypothetical protein Z957_11480 [Clostridium sp. K25]
MNKSKNKGGQEDKNINLSSIKKFFINIQIKVENNLRLNAKVKRGDINFFCEYLENTRSKLINSILRVLLISTFIILIMVTYINYRFINKMNKDINDMEVYINLPHSQAKVKEYKKLTNKIKILNKYWDNVNTLTNNILSNNSVGSYLLNNVSLCVPNEVSFLNISFSNNNIEIQGISSSRIAIAEFQHNLKALYKVEEVYVGNINENVYSSTGSTNGGNTSYNFTLNCRLKGVEYDKNK